MKVQLTLVADGPFDSALLPVLVHLLRRDPRVTEIDQNFAAPDKLPPVSAGLARRVQTALHLYPANLLVVHRDAERDTLAARRYEIEHALAGIAPSLPPCASAIPVRMTEAWLLFDSSAIRTAAGNPNGRTSLDLPRLQDVERLSDPKQRLHETLEKASGRSGRALAKFNVREAATRVAELIEDFSPLDVVPAFRSLEQDLKAALDKLAEKPPTSTVTKLRSKG